MATFKFYSANEFATSQKIKRVSELYHLPRRRNRKSGKMSVNVSASIDKALDIAIAAAQTAEEKEK